MQEWLMRSTRTIMQVLMSESLKGKVDLEGSLKKPELKLSALFVFSNGTTIESEIKQAVWNSNNNINLISILISSFELVSSLNDLLFIQMPLLNLKIENSSMEEFILSKVNNYEYELTISIKSMET